MFTPTTSRPDAGRFRLTSALYRSAILACALWITLAAGPAFAVPPAEESDHPDDAFFWLKGDLGFSQVTNAVVSSDLGTTVVVEKDTYYGRTRDGRITRVDMSDTTVDRRGWISGHAVVQVGEFRDGEFDADHGATVPVRGRVLYKVTGVLDGVQKTNNLYGVSGRGRDGDGHVYSFRINLYQKNNRGWQHRSDTDAFWGRTNVSVSGVATSRNEHIVEGFDTNEVKFTVTHIDPTNSRRSRWVGDAVVEDDFGKLEGGRTTVSLSFPKGNRPGTARVSARVDRYVGTVSGLHDAAQSDTLTLDEVEDTFRPTYLKLQKHRALTMIRIPPNAYLP